MSPPMTRIVVSKTLTVTSRRKRSSESTQPRACLYSSSSPMR